MKVTDEMIEACKEAMREWRDSDCSGTAVTWEEWTLEVLGFHREHLPAFAVLVAHAADNDLAESTTMHDDANLIDLIEQGYQVTRAIDVKKFANGAPSFLVGIIQALQTYECDQLTVVSLASQAAGFAMQSIPEWITGRDRDRWQADRDETASYLAGIV